MKRPQALTTNTRCSGGTPGTKIASLTARKVARKLQAWVANASKRKVSTTGGGLESAALPTKASWANAPKIAADDHPTTITCHVQFVFVQPASVRRRGIDKRRNVEVKIHVKTTTAERSASKPFLVTSAEPKVVKHPRLAEIRATETRPVRLTSIPPPNETVNATQRTDGRNNHRTSPLSKVAPNR